MNRQGFRATLGVLSFAISGAAMAIGLGDLRGQLVLGDQPALSVNVLGADNALPEASCFRLVKPRSGDQLPWLREADLRIRPGRPPVLLISGGQRVRDPVVQVALHIACGHEVYREYTLLASPRAEPETVEMPARIEAQAERPVAKAPPRPPRAQASPRVSQSRAVSQREPVAARVVAEDSGDRLMLSAGSGDGETALRLDAVLGEHMLAGEIAETQRDILRLEYRMLAALHEQASSQLAAAEKLRSMESALDELQGKTLALTEKANGQVVPTPPVRETPERAAAMPGEEGGLFSSWGFYGLLLGILLGLAGWLFWRRRQQRDEDVDSLLVGSPEPVIDEPRAEELQEKAELDLHLDAAAAGEPQRVDVELEGGAAAAPVQQTPAQALHGRPGDSVLSISATTLDEHFEANPVMELADIMLSFGRVKGAAQALQEYVDNNPSEALQPWLRLMDVYRMAGMREEFDVLARNLNQQFNVEIQPWEVPAAPVDLVLDGETPSDAVPAVPGVPKPQGVEDMPRIMTSIVRMWEAEDVVGYMYQLLRDNRGGQRLGFPLPVVEEVLFLIELKETSNRMEKEKAEKA